MAASSLWSNPQTDGNPHRAGSEIPPHICSPRGDDWAQGDHFLSFQRQRGDGQFDEVLKTEVKKSSKDANWGQLKFNMLKLCLGNLSAPIKIQVCDEGFVLLT